MSDSKWKQTMIKKLGSEEAVSEHMANISKKQIGIPKPTSGTAALSKEERSRRGKDAANKRWGNTNGLDDK